MLILQSCVLCFLFYTTLALEISNEDPFFLRKPPQFEQNVNLLSSYIPATMQVIAHLTELMKYDMRPNKPGKPSSTTIRPTSTHKPGVFAPNQPLGPENYLLRRSYDGELNRYKTNSDISYSNVYGPLPLDLNNYIGQAPLEILKLVNKIDDDDFVYQPNENFKTALDFSKIYDDSLEMHEFRAFLEKNKRSPPTRAYVSLLTLYDLLNKEAKKLGFNKYQGYSHQIVVELSETWSGTSANQLKTVLAKILDRKDTKNPAVIKKINELIGDLKEDSSYISAALRYIPPLPFSV